MQLFWHAGYSTAEVLGRNPRFMQGPESSPVAIAELGDAVRAGRPTVVELINHRRNGSKFWNQARAPLVASWWPALFAHAACHSACRRLQHVAGMPLLCRDGAREKNITPFSTWGCRERLPLWSFLCPTIMSQELGSQQTLTGAQGHAGFCSTVS